MPAIEANGTRLEYTEAGRGEPLVFVHGSLEDYRAWRLQMGPFGQHYRAIAYSRRYHYPNPPGGSGHDYTAARHADDLAALIGRLALAPVRLVASSFGGYVALYLAAHQPKLVHSLVLGEPPLMLWLADAPGGAGLAEGFRDQTWNPTGQAFAAGDPERGVGLFLDAIMGQPTFEHLAPASRAALMDNAAAMQVEALSPGYFSPLTRQDVEAVRQPVLLLQAERSPRLFHIILDELARCLPQARRATIPAAPHAMHLGNPEAYNEVVLAFLAGLRPAAQ